MPIIVLIGRFNPAIFQPGWMAANKLIRNEEAIAAKAFVALPDFLTFRTAWFRIQVTDERFEALCTEGGHEGPFKDLVVAIFTLLEHTPFDRMGLNYSTHQQLESEEAFSRIARSLSNPTSFESILTDPEFRSIIMEGRHDEAPGARIQIRVERSSRVTPGVFIATNEHYERTGPNAGRQLIELLNSRWGGAMAYARRIVASVETLQHEMRR